MSAPVVHLCRRAGANPARSRHHADVRPARRGDPRIHPRGEARRHRVPAHAPRGGGGVCGRRDRANRSPARRLRLDARARRAQHDARRRQRVSRSLAGDRDHGDDGGGVGAVCDASESRSERGLSSVHQDGDHARRARIRPPRFAARWPRRWRPGRVRCTSRCRATSRSCRSRRPKTRRASPSSRRRLRRRRPRRSPRCCGHRVGQAPGRGARPGSAPARSCSAGARIRRTSRRAGVRHAEGQRDAARRSSAVFRRLRRRRRRQRDHGFLRARRSHHRHRLRAGRVRQAVAPHDEAGVDRPGVDRGRRLSPARGSRGRRGADALRPRRAIAGAVRVDRRRSADVSRRSPARARARRRRLPACPASS